MKIKNLLFLLVVLFYAGTASAQAPLAGCWHPDFIKDWVPEKDPDRKFNKSTIPLQPRIPTGETVKAHSQQFPEGQVAACLTMHPMCSQVPSQGAYNFIGYNPTYWQYLDLLIWWGGSAGEGIILPPSAPVIDAAHMSGTKVLGQIFFPTTTHSGLPAWTHQMNTAEENGIPYPYARKCAEIAKYYGFDGWFLNSETVTSTDWTSWTREYLRYAKEELGLEGQEIQLYNMSSSVGTSAQNVARQIGGSFMVNYGGTNATINAISGHSDETAWGKKFESYYAGQEQSGSVTANGSNFNALFPTSGHKGSVQWFNPEEPIWKQPVKNLLGTENACGSSAYTAMTTVFRNEQNFWTNTSGDVTNTTRGGSSAMPGQATAIQERSAIQNLPFVTSFSAGLGKHWFVNGEKRGTQDWYHRGMQTVMPTWRWWQVTSSSNKISFAYNWDDAYNMGTSINLSGNLTNTNYTLNLYKTKLAISSGDRLELVYKTNKPGSIKVRLGVDATTAVTTAYEPVSTTTRNGWTVDVYDLSALAGQTLRMVSLGINAGASGSGFTAQLGQLGIYPAGYNPSEAQVSNLEVQNDLAPETGDLRIVWDHPANISNISHYNVYLTRNGETKLAGQTRNEGYYIPKFTRNGQSESSVAVQVKAVYKNMEEATSAPEPIEIPFPSLDLPVIKITASKSLLLPDEEVTFTATATNFPDAYVWQAPAAGTGTLVSQTGNKAVYKFTTNGKHNVTVAATNSVGTTTHVEEGIVNVQSAELTIVSRSANGGSVAGSNNGYDCNAFMTASNENPGYLIDNTTVPSSTGQKWCAGGEKEHWVIITLNNIYELYRFVIYDCGHKENASDNLTFYKIFTSTDKVNWELVLDQQNVPATAAYNTKDHYIAPTFAKYIKFVPYDPDKAITIRLWQFDAYGLAGTPTPSLTNLKADKRAAKTGEQVTFTVDATQNPTSFNWIVTGGTKVSQNDTSTGSTAVFTFAQEGFYDVKVEATNAGGTKNAETKRMVQISDSEDLISVGKQVVLASNGSTGKDFLTDGITEPANVNNKWYATGAADYWAIIDLEAEYDITRFITFDCRTMEPTVLSNITHYNIYVATTIDAQGEGDWQLAVRGRNAVDKNIKDDILETPVTGRYVKFAPYDWSLFEVRAFEFEIYGKSAYAGTITTPEGGLNLKTGKTQPVEVSYELDPAVSGSHSITVTTSHADRVLITNQNVNNGKLTFNVKGLAVGAATLTVKLVHGEKSMQRSIPVIVTAGTPETVQEQQNLTMRPGNSQPLTLAYSLGDMDKEGNYGITVVSGNTAAATVSDISYNSSLREGNLTFKVNAVAIGASTVTVTLTNGETTVVKTFIANVVQPESFTQPSDENVKHTRTKEVTVQYSLGGMPKGSDFAYRVTSANESFVTISNVLVDEAAKTIKFNLNGVAVGGPVNVEVELTNEGRTFSTSFGATVQALIPESVNAHSNIDMRVDSTRRVNVTYTLGDMYEDAEFNYEVTAGNSNIQILNKSINKATKTISFDINGVVRGQSTVTVKIINGTATPQIQFAVNIFANESFTKPQDEEVKLTKSAEVTVAYRLGDIGQKADFAISAVSSNANVMVSQPVVTGDEAGGTAKITITGAAVGNAGVTVSLTNDGQTIDTDFNVNVIALTPESMVTPSNATVRLNAAQTISVSYSLGDMDEENNLAFTFTKSSGTGNVSFGTPVINKEEKTVSVAITGTTAGSAVVRVDMTNGSSVIQPVTFAVTVQRGESFTNPPATAEVRVGQVTPLTVNFNLGQVQKQGDFSVEVTSDDTGLATISDVVPTNINNVTGNIKFNVNGVALGTPTVTVKLTNGGNTIQTVISVSVLSSGAALEESLGSVADVNDLKTTQTRLMQISYSLGDAVENNLQLNAVAGNGSVVEISDKNFASGMFTFNLKGLAVGTTKVTVTLSNGGSVKVTKEFNVTVSDFVGEWLEDISNATVKETQSRQIQVAYNLNDAETESNFAITAVAGNNSVLQISNESQLTGSAGNFTFDITGLAVGPTKVTVTLTNGTTQIQKEFTATVSALVRESLGNVSDITDLKEGQTYPVQISYNLGDMEQKGDFAIAAVAVNGSIVSISNQVTADGRFSFDVVGLAEGSSNVTVTLTNDGAVRATKEFTVVVKALTRESLGAAENEYVRLGQTKTGIQIVYSLGDMAKDPGFSITAVAENNSIVSISNQSVSGTTMGNFSFDITGLAEGNTKITVTLSNGSGSAVREFNVSVVSVIPESLGTIADRNLKINDPETIRAIYSLGDMPESNFSITVNAENGSIVQISDINYQNGELTFVAKALTAGSTKVTVTLNNGDKSITEDFMVYASVRIAESISKPADMVINQNAVQFVSVIYNLGEMDRDATFSIEAVSGNQSVVLISEQATRITSLDFNVQGIALGTSKITVTLTNGTSVVTEDFNITVVENIPESLNDQDDVSMAVGGTETITILYSLGEMVENANFDITVVAENGEVIEIQDKTVTPAEVIFDVKGLVSGKSKVFVTLINGETRINKEFTVTVGTGTGLNEANTSSISVWPNPVRRGETVYVATEGAEQIRMISLQGVVIKQQEAYGKVTEFSTFDVARGLYLIEIIGETTKVEKLIVK